MKRIRLAACITILCILSLFASYTLLSTRGHSGRAPISILQYDDTISTAAAEQTSERTPFAAAKANAHNRLQSTKPTTQEVKESKQSPKLAASSVSQSSRSVEMKPEESVKFSAMTEWMCPPSFRDARIRGRIAEGTITSLALPINVVFVKTMKTGGSTMTGVLRSVFCDYGYKDVRLGIVNTEEEYNQIKVASKTPKMNRSWWKPPQLEVETHCVQHSFFGNHMLFREVERTILPRRPEAEMITIIRSPKSLCLSAAYFFGIRRFDYVLPRFRKPEMKGLATEEVVEKLVFDFIDTRDVCRTNQQFQYIQSTRHGEEITNESDPRRDVENVMRMYSFIAITERFDESLIVLAHKWNITLADIVYIKSKEKPIYEVKGIKGFEDAIVSSSFSDQSDRVQALLQSDTFKKRKAHDIMLYEEANKRLDEYIKRIPDIDVLLERFSRAKEALHEDCSTEVREGDGNNCLWRDGGCAIRCKRRALKRGDGPYAGLNEPLRADVVKEFATFRDHSRQLCREHNRG